MGIYVICPVVKDRPIWTYFYVSNQIKVIFQVKITSEENHVIVKHTTCVTGLNEVVICAGGGQCPPPERTERGGAQKNFFLSGNDDQIIEN